MDYTQFRAEVAKEIFLDAVDSRQTKTLPDVEKAAIFSVVCADYLIKALGGDSSDIVTIEPAKHKGCRACYGSGGKADAPCKKCKGTGKVAV